MRSNSQAPKKQIIRQPVTDKSITSTRPQTRRTSLQPQMRKTTTKVGEPHLRPKKCPNCGSSFSPSQYVVPIPFRTTISNTVLGLEKSRKKTKICLRP